MASPVPAAPADAGSIIESVITKGNLDQLTPQERTRYYVEVCKSVGLNPLTRPFEYIRLNGQLVLYARRDCTDQLRSLHDVSVESLEESNLEGVFVVTAKVRNGKGRTDMAKGAVPIVGLKGEALANALMKTETKAKRRATLSICGLGMLDESEVESVSMGGPPPLEERPVVQGNQAPNQFGPKVKPLPPAPPQQPVYDPETGDLGPHSIPLGDGNDRWLVWGRALIGVIGEAHTSAEGEAWIDQNQSTLDECRQLAPKVYGSIERAISQMVDRTQTMPDFMDAEIS